MKITSIGTVLVAVLLALPAFGQQASREEFKEFCRAMEGRWLCEIPLSTDQIGFGKKGETVISHVEITLVEDGHALFCRAFPGPLSLSRTSYYDPVAKQIREYAVRSDGRVWTAVVFKENGQWVRHINGATTDGRKTEGKYRVVISDGGKTHTWTGTFGIVGEKASSYSEVARRSGK